MTRNPNMYTFHVSVPKAWLSAIDKSRGDCSMDTWIRDLIRDALKQSGNWPEIAKKEAQK